MKVIYVLGDGAVMWDTPKRFSEEWRHAWVLRIASRLLGRPYTSRPGRNGSITVDRERGMMIFRWNEEDGEP